MLPFFAFLLEIHKVNVSVEAANRFILDKLRQHLGAVLEALFCRAALVVVFRPQVVRLPIADAYATALASVVFAFANDVAFACIDASLTYKRFSCSYVYFHRSLIALE